MTLDEYRMKIIERLRACQDDACARSLIDEVDTMLHDSRIGKHTHEVFWQALEEDLDALEEEARFLANPEASAALEAVVTAARARAVGFLAQTLKAAN